MKLQLVCLTGGSVGWDNNVLDNPEKFGLRLVGTMEYSDMNYCFDTRAVWERLSDGTLYTARDSGCSCPTPFGQTTELDRLFSVSELEEEFQTAVKYEYDFKPDALAFSKFRKEVLAVFKALDSKPPSD